MADRSEGAASFAAVLCSVIPSSLATHASQVATSGAMSNRRTFTIGATRSQRRSGSAPLALQVTRRR